MAVDVVSLVVSAAASSVLSAVTATVVLKVNQRWHKEKLDRHSTSLKNAFDAIDVLRKDGNEKHEQQQREIHRLEVEMYRMAGEKR